MRLYDAAEGLLRIVDVAPELPGAVEFTRRASEKCRVSVAHTAAGYDQAAAVFDAGATHLTHLFNAMSGIHHRHPGPIGAASERENVTAELIDLSCRLLRQAGYPCGSCGQCVARLVQRLRTEEEFPHEVGLFLSYPPEDVQGFIDHRAEDFKCAGLWKVYGDEQRAQLLFDRFRRCTQRYCALWQTGYRLEQLAVAV